MGLAVVSTLQNFANASTIVANEATQPRAIYSDISAYPEPCRLFATLSCWTTAQETPRLPDKSN